jgi:hypothetical protein
MMNSPGIQRALDERADAIKAAASARIKKVTGHTAESVAVEDATRDDGVQVRHVGYDLSKDVSGPYYEFGTEDTPPHPTLRVAAKSVK